jgi:regulator of sirC expression with transglutaminase-like and TPR domain
MDVDATLRRLAADPFAPVDLAALALHLAADEYPDLDVAPYLARLDAYAGDVAPRLSGPLHHRVEVLAEFLFDEEGFTGDAAAYYDPRNSYLNDVLDRKLGIPLTLSLVAMAVGERAGLTVHGVGLPGHFVAKAVAGDDEVLFDPYHGGAVLDRDGCAELVEAATGRPFLVTDDVLETTPPGLIARRMLTNLKGVYLRQSNFARAARVTGRLAVLAPDDPTQLRDLGVTLVHAGQPGKAIDPLSEYLAAAPDAADAGAVGDVLKDARRQVARWN